MTKRITLASQGLVIEQLRLEVAQLKADLAVARQPKAAPSVKPTYRSTWAPSAEQLARREAMAAAKALAMRIGKSVRVEG